MKINTQFKLTPPPSKRIISANTKKQYGRITNLLRASVLETKPDGHIVDATPLEIVDYLFNQRSRLRPQTFLMYRSALIWWLSTLTVDASIQDAWITLHELVPKDGYKDEKGEKGKARLYSIKSSRKRTVSQKKLRRLLDELTHRTDAARTYIDRRRASELRFWVLAGLATGLRPTEWSQAYWRNKAQGELNVITAKRKVGNYSLPDISHLSDEEPMPVRVVKIDDEQDIAWVDLHMKSVQAYLQSGEGRTFDRYYDNNRMYLRTINKAIFPKGDGVTLYMLRGQFAANRKISGQPREELAKEMGCGSYYTSAAYGKQVHGYKNLRGTRVEQQDRQAEQEAQVESNSPYDDGFQSVDVPSQASRITESESVSAPSPAKASPPPMKRIVPPPSVRAMRNSGGG